MSERATAGRSSCPPGDEASGTPGGHVDDRADWLEWRRHGLGGSDAAALVGLSSYSSRWALWAEKVGLLPDRPTTERLRMGQLFEAAIAQLFRERTGLAVVGSQACREHERLSWARCTLDGYVVESPDSDVSDALGVFEAKTDARHHWDEVPVPIRAQVVWQLGVTQLRHAWVAVVHAGFGFGVYEVAWDDDAERDWALMRDAGERFWNDHVTTGVAPEVDGSDATYDALKVVYPDVEPGERVALDDLAVEVYELTEVRGRVADLQRHERQLRNQILDAFGQAHIGTIGGVDVMARRWVERAAYEVEATRYPLLRAITRKATAA